MTLAFLAPSLLAPLDVEGVHYYESEADPDADALASTGFFVPRYLGSIREAEAVGAAARLLHVAADDGDRGAAGMAGRGAEDDDHATSPNMSSCGSMASTSPTSHSAGFGLPLAKTRTY